VIAGILILVLAYLKSAFFTVRPARIRRSIPSVERRLSGVASIYEHRSCQSQKKKDASQHDMIKKA